LGVVDGKRGGFSLLDNQHLVVDVVWLVGWLVGGVCRREEEKKKKKKKKRETL
jgi:hypothetical protein